MYRKTAKMAAVCILAVALVMNPMASIGAAQSAEWALTGTWRTSTDDGAQIVLMLKHGSLFVLQFWHPRLVANHTGMYSVNGNVLTLTSYRGGSSVAGVITPLGTNMFHFNMLNGSEDAGLIFVR